MSNFISPANGASQGNNFLPKKAGAKSTPSYSSDLHLLVFYWRKSFAQGAKDQHRAENSL